MTNHKLYSRVNHIIIHNRHTCQITNQLMTGWDKTMNTDAHLNMKESDRAISCAAKRPINLKLTDTEKTNLKIVPHVKPDNAETKSIIIGTIKIKR